MTYYLPSLTVLLIFGCLISYQYIQELRGENKQLKLQVARLSVSVMHPYAEMATPAREMAVAEPEKPKPFPLNGIGPTAIRDRELRREQDEKERTTPEMIVMRPPTEAEIAEATKKILREQGQLN